MHFKVKEKYLVYFKNGIVYENPLFVSLLGLCPALATTTSLKNSFAMGISFIIILFFSNIFISIIRKIVPNEIRIPVYIVIIASFVSVIEMLMQAYFISLYNSLGLFISLIVVNCIVLGRAEAFASKNTVLDSVVDALSIGFGYFISLILIGIVREFLSNGSIDLFKSFSIDFNRIFIKEGKLGIFSDFFSSSSGAFIVLAFVIAFFQNIIYKRGLK